MWSLTSGRLLHYYCYRMGDWPPLNYHGRSSCCKVFGLNGFCNSLAVSWIWSWYLYIYLMKFETKFVSGILQYMLGVFSSCSFLAAVFHPFTASGRKFCIWTVRSCDIRSPAVQRTWLQRGVGKRHGPQEPLQLLGADEDQRLLQLDPAHFVRVVWDKRAYERRKRWKGL